MWRGKLLDGEIMLQTTPRILNTFTGGGDAPDGYRITHIPTLERSIFLADRALAPFRRTRLLRQKSLIDLTFVSAISRRRYRQEIQQIIQSNRYSS